MKNRGLPDGGTGEVNMKRIFGKRGEGPRFLFALLAAFLTITVCSKSSFLYPFNDWVDVNCFFTVGRGILHGLTPYRDLYEQKGPLTYLLFALAAAVSESSYIGVYVIETLCYAAFVYIGGRIAETVSGFRGAFWPAAALTAVLVPISPAFSHGSSAEEFFLPVFAAGIWIALRAMEERRPLRNGEGLALGLCSAAALWTKYTFCGLFAGMGLAVLAWYIARGWARKLPRVALWFFGGAAGLSALILGWFALQGAAGDLWQAYFVNNLAEYGKNVKGGHYDPPLQNLLNNLTWAVPGALGIGWLALTGKRRGWQAAAVLLGAAGLFWFTYLNGRRYPYYALVMAVFAPIGLGAVCRGIALGMKSRPRLLRGAVTAVTAAVMICVPLVCRQQSGNVYLMDIPREDTPQYRFAETIREAEDPSLLNYGFLDGGFYFAAGVLPESPWFCTLNINLKEMDSAMRRSLQEGETQFVVTRSKKLDGELPYRLIDEASMVFEGRQWTYYLYERV